MVPAKRESSASYCIKRGGGVSANFLISSLCRSACLDGASCFLKFNYRKVVHAHWGEDSFRPFHITFSIPTASIHIFFHSSGYGSKRTMDILRVIGKV